MKIVTIYSTVPAKRNLAFLGATVATEFYK